ncbi:hypothetical protein GCM10022239_09330 [Leifsonia bigeumensis]|uniref:DUF2142 domain-containing protein n=1 Tax=Leifsonella bigeumensis TaxID=433643 RepID=A0ABP7FC90_9MICO
MSPERSPATSRLLRDKVRGFRVIWLAPLLAFVALASWALASPMGASPDDDYHLVSTWCADPGKTWACEVGTDLTQRVVPEALVKSPLCFAHHPERSAACQKDTFSLDPVPTEMTHRGNFAGQYPPVYYAAMNIVVSPNLEFSVVLMRLINAFVFVAITTALFAALPSIRRPALVWGWLASTVPLGLFLIASNNPSSWAIVGVGTSWIALLGYLESSGRRKVGLGLIFVVSVIMAAGSRGDTAVYAGFAIALVLVLRFRNVRRFWMDAILPLVMGVVAGLFVLMSRQSQFGVEGLPSTAVSDPTVASAAAQSSDSFGHIATLLFNVPSLWAGVFGYWGLGWLDTGMPAIVTFGAITVAVGAVFTGLRVMTWRKAIALGAIATLLVFIPTWVLYQGGQQVGQEVQPRYLLPLIVMFIGLAMVSANGRSPRLTRTQRILVGVTISVAQLVALYFNMRRYIHGDTPGTGWNLDQHTLWWWDIAVSPMTVLLVGSLAFSVTIWILLFRTPEIAGISAKSEETEPVRI